tara:strand:- start:582 stop:1040 length:459 start_codon:yes stop_codon:yes gene_type:complete
MNNESMPPELDVFISLLGEIDMLKSQVGVLDKNTHIALSQSDTSAILGNSECFRILKLIETLNANLSGLNASLLNAAELVTDQYPPTDNDEESEEKKSTSLMEDIIAGREEIEERREQEKQKDENKGSKKKKENEVINNMLSYFKERFEGNE